MTDMLDSDRTALHDGGRADGSGRPSKGDRSSEGQRSSEAGISMAARLLLGGTGAMIVATGLVLWSVRGPVIFTDMLSAAIAWCF